MRIAFRADASPELGTGHVLRCLNLAKALNDKGAECIFVCRELPIYLREKILSNGIRVESLIRAEGAEQVPSLPLSRKAIDSGIDIPWSADAEDTIRIISLMPVDWLVVDHYALDHRWEARLRKWVRRIMVIDDLADRMHECDLLLDQNLVKDAHDRYTPLVPSSCAILIGPHYALLQSVYAQKRQNATLKSEPVRRILVSFGGSDQQNLNFKTVDAFLSLQRTDIKLDVVLGSNPEQEDLLRARVGSYENITIHGFLPDLSSLMIDSDLSVGAGGTTSWERCCLGLPSIVITLAENQVALARELHRRGAIRWLGMDNSVTQDSLASAIKHALEGSSLSVWSAICKSLVDGTGAKRVASALFLDSNSSIRTRVATPEDEELILRWANDPIVRKNGFSEQAISDSDHHIWYTRQVAANPHKRFFIVQTEDDLDIGQVRFEQVESGWEVHYSLSVIARGLGLSRKVLRVSIDALFREIGAVPLIGKVKKSNLASIRVFEGLGFSMEDQGANLLYFRLGHKFPGL